MKTQSKVDKSNNMEKSGPSRKVLVLNDSPTGENSITLQTVLFIANAFSNTEFSYLHVGKRIKAYEKDFAECKGALESADLIVFCYPVYTFLVPAQLHRFIGTTILIQCNGEPPMPQGLVFLRHGIGSSDWSRLVIWTPLDSAYRMVFRVPPDSPL